MPAVLLLLAGCASTAATGSTTVPTRQTTASASTTTRVAATTIPPATPAPATTIPPGPPFAVGSTVLHLVDNSRPTVSRGTTISSSRALTTLVWFPEVSHRVPLIVFAHGFRAGPSPYVTMLEAWAAHGYVVAAPEFPLTDVDVAGPALDENDINNQPADVRFVADSLVAASSPVAGRIDASRVAIAGHSDGAETALAASVQPVPAGAPPFRALIAMSVQELPGVTHTANPPMLVTQGDADTINPPSYGYGAYQDGSSPKFLVVIKGGGHLPPLEAGSTWLPGIDAVTEAFLDAYVAGSASVQGVRAALSGSSLFSVEAG